ncbi:hypothetical protein [Limnoglobus roseus]|uniref:Glycosyltransferase RgtA/B/C/D-like domain-containing protein n=1 Tax=Limnoglobus roseus TaxID=2598579 RepID=A0A5C1A747_9BACT|nr:hypothetical protein [Limnoglobus roseus]QEL15021.1 hypothetical protein PX52LOC_01926 [Limnoglobus roseus]
MNSVPDPAALRRSIYLILTWVAVAIAAAKVVGVELVVEPSRFQPPPGTFGSDRPANFIPAKAWPAERPEPTPLLSSNDRSRWATVRALVDDGTFVIGRRQSPNAKAPPFPDHGIIFEGGWEAVDKVMDPHTGQFYSTKPPLFPVMMAAEYWVLKHTLGWQFNRDKWPIVVTILLTVNVLPFAVYLILLARLIEQYGTSDFAKVFTFAAAAFGTFVTTFAVTLNNHTPAIFCVLFALYPLLRKRPPGSSESPADLFFSGFFAGLTATFELPAAAFTAGLALPLLIARPKATLTWFLPGVLVPLVALLACMYAAMGSFLPAYGEFGGPWYKFPGSHWNKLDDPNSRGIDFNKQGTPIYAFNLLLGHHGWFSLTPVWVLGLVGLAMSAKWNEVRRVFAKPTDAVWNPRLLAAMTLAISAVVFAFYLMQTKSYNYGGNTAAARWLIWLTPLWLFGLLAGAERVANSKVGRGIAAGLLGFSVLSVFYPAWNPWRSPWLLQLAEVLDWVHY